VREGLTALESRQGARAPTRRIPEEGRAGFLARGDGLPVERATGRVRAPREGECFMALARDSLGGLEAGPFQAQLAPGDLEQRVRAAPGKPPVPLGEVLARGDVLEVCVTAAATPPGALPVQRRPRPWAESAAVVLENATGNVVALAGGYDVGLEGFVRATQARRQPGSSFKPFVYATGIQGGLRQDSIVVDAPFSVLGTNGLPWRPKNYDGEYHGPILLRNALALSLNTVAVRLAHQAGVERITDLARALGVKTPLRGDLTVALGSSEVTPMDLAVGYSSLARMGVRIEPVWITSVADRLGAELGRAGEPLRVSGAASGELPGAPGARALDPATAYVVVDMMRNVVRAGTAKKAQREGMDFAGKTGTTSGFVDAWFVGFSPRYTVAVWVGTDGKAPLGDKETGGKAALPTWSRIMDALPNVPGERFPVPAGVTLLPAAVAGEEVLWLGYARDAIPSATLPEIRLGAADPLPSFGGAFPVARLAEEPSGAGLPPLALLELESLPEESDAEASSQGETLLPEEVSAGATLVEGEEDPGPEAALPEVTPRKRAPAGRAGRGDRPEKRKGKGKKRRR
jgi:membrane peptidoglycan carboxypeptidase